MNVLITQNSQNVSHTHSEESAGKHSHSTNSTKNEAGTANKSLTGSYKYAADVAGCWNTSAVSGIFSCVADSNVTQGVATTNNYNRNRAHLDATHSHTTNEVAAHTHTINSSGGTETRTVNYSYKVWKRVS